MFNFKARIPPLGYIEEVERLSEVQPQYGRCKCCRGPVLTSILKLYEGMCSTCHYKRFAIKKETEDTEYDDEPFERYLTVRKGVGLRTRRDLRRRLAEGEYHIPGYVFDHVTEEAEYGWKLRFRIKL